MHTRLIPALAVALAIVATLLVTSRGSSSRPAVPQGATIPLVAPSPTPPALDPKLAAVLYYPSAAHAFSVDQLIALYQQAARARPHDPIYLDRLADAYIEKARQNGDVTYYNLAEAALQQARRLNPHDYLALVYSGWVRLTWHQFAEAATLAREAIAIDPRLDQAYGVLGDGMLELGRYDEADAAFTKMDQVRPSLASYNRVSYLLWLHGDASGAIAAMQLAIAAGSAYPENVAWCQVQQGNTYFALGDLRRAETQYQAALGSFPHYLHALAGLAQVRAAQRRYPEALALYRQAIAVEPLPQYVAALGDLQATLGDRAGAATQYALVELVDRLYGLNHIRFGIDRAYFEADHGRNLAEAVGLARDELRTRHDIRTEDSAAWVFYQAGRYGEALRAERAALRYGTREALYQFHLGMILARMGDRTSGRQALQTALRWNPYFSPRYVPVARAELARLQAAGTTGG